MQRLLAQVLVGVSIVVFMLYLCLFHYTPVGQVGIMRDMMTGEVRLDHTGMNFSPPWVQVAHIPTTPQRVCITSATRAYNCRLAQFEPSAYQEFVQTEGFRYYWFDNRISFNGGYDDEYRGPKDLIRGYAFSAKKYPFVTVLNDYIPE
ncbi:MAG: hypothetical protein NUV56_01820 [Candidatus Uhrbacteria bacterium]|nr:hypothetical protein [Candidatus Uhrbacteria bacterium]